MTTTDIAPSPLVYNGTPIRDRNEMLSLTDMWKAKGSPENMEPFNWARKEGSSFIDAVTVAHNLPDSQVMATKRGKGGGTWAHWQIGLAYAKYLDHDMHMWCNEVVRERMEGSRNAGALPAAALEQIERSFGIIRMLAHKVTETEKLVNVMAATMQPHAPGVVVAEGLTAGEICDLSRVTAKYPRGIAGRVSKRMKQFCAVRGLHVPVTRLGRVHAWVFPTSAAREWLEMEGRGLISRWVEEKKGQTVLRLVQAPSLVPANA